MRSIVLGLSMAAAVLALSPAWADDANDNTAEALMQHEKQRDALAQERMGGGVTQTPSQAHVAESMLNTPVRTQDATPMGDDDTGNGTANNNRDAARAPR